MSVTFLLILIFVGLFITILSSIELGRRLGSRRAARGVATTHPGMAAVEASIFGLMGLLLAFSFHGAADRFFTRRHLIVEETNAIGTAWMRISALPPDTQPALRDLFRRYLDSRLATYSNLLDSNILRTETDRSDALQAEIWEHAIVATGRPEGQRAIVVMLNSLNEMFDIRTTRLMALRQHPPILLFVMLGLLVYTGGFMAGNGMVGMTFARWLYPIMFAAILSITIYVIIDMEFPRVGLINVESFDNAPEALRRSMDVPTQVP